MTVADVCDVAYAMLVDEYQNDGRAVIAAGDERAPHEFRTMVDKVLTEDADATGRVVPQAERELRNALGVK